MLIISVEVFQIVTPRSVVVECQSFSRSGCLQPQDERNVLLLSQTDAMNWILE
jgi:hypothetical protein